jgi:sugar/nucleoside kinase (ribokinase family)
VADVNFALVGQAKIFHLGYPPLLPKLIQHEAEELIALWKQAKATGVVTAQDMVMPDPDKLSGQADWHDILRKTLPNIDIFIPSIEEILFMLRRADYEAWGADVLKHVTRAYLSGLADQLLDMGAVITGFKLGELGMYLKTGSEAQFERLRALAPDKSAWTNVELWHPAFQVEVAGTTGAGDAAYAGFHAALLHRASPQEAIQWACAVGACSVEAVDSNSGVRTWEETLRRMKTGWKTRSEFLSGF